MRFVVKNKGDESVSSSDTVTIEIKVDNRLEWDEDYRNSSSSSNFLDEGKSSTYEADVLDNDDDSQKIEVCVDTEDEVDEDSESNNCRTETLDPDDEDDHEPEDDRNHSNFEYCGAFTDLNGYGWAEDQICDLYADGVVNGRSYNRYEPSANITRAEFLKMALLSAGENPSYTTGVYYRDVRSTDWYYSYVSYGTSRGYVNGYANNEFRPNAYITRAEALVMLMRIYDEENFDFDDSDIEFWDVREWDWFAYAVVLGDEAGFINGYGDGSFRPHSFITRAEAAVMVVGANEAFE